MVVDALAALGMVAVIVAVAFVVSAGVGLLIVRLGITELEGTPDAPSARRGEAPTPGR